MSGPDFECDPQRAPEPVIAAPGSAPIAAAGISFSVREWSMSGPGWLHVHTADDEAFHVLEGRLRFRFPDREVEAMAGTTVFVPAGVAHTYAADVASRYLIILTPKIDRLIAHLVTRPANDDVPALLAAFDTVPIETIERR